MWPGLARLCKRASADRVVAEKVRDSSRDDVSHPTERRWQLRSALSTFHERGGKGRCKRRERLLCFRQKNPRPNRCAFRQWSPHDKMETAPPRTEILAAQSRTTWASVYLTREFTRR